MVGVEGAWAWGSHLIILVDLVPEMDVESEIEAEALTGTVPEVERVPAETVFEMLTVMEYELDTVMVEDWETEREELIETEPLKDGEVVPDTEPDNVEEELIEMV